MSDATAEREAFRRPVTIAAGVCSAIAAAALGWFGVAPAYEAASSGAVARAAPPAPLSAPSASVVPNRPVPPPVVEPPRPLAPSAIADAPRPPAQTAVAAAWAPPPSPAPRSSAIGVSSAVAPSSSVASAAPSASSAATAPSVGEGFLNINSLPASLIVLDGKPIGSTPKVHVQVTAGAHTVVFTNSDLGVMKEVSVTVAAGETTLATAKLRD
jgi:hypothetical protein